MALFLNLVGSIPIGLFGSLVVFVATVLGAAVPALSGGLGTYEAAAVFTLKGFGYSFEEALALALTVHVCLLSLSIVLTLIIVLTERIGLSALIK